MSIGVHGGRIEMLIEHDEDDQQWVVTQDKDANPVNLVDNNAVDFVFIVSDKFKNSLKPRAVSGLGGFALIGKKLNGLNAFVLCVF